MKRKSPVVVTGLSLCYALKYPDEILPMDMD
jgi:hypothetical protein